MQQLWSYRSFISKEQTSIGIEFVASVDLWKTKMFSSPGFHSNIVSALDDLKSDESFVDVTLSCDGETIQVRLEFSGTFTNLPFLGP